MHPANVDAAENLLAIDLGLRTGMALYGRDGRLQSYRSQHFGTREQLRRAAARTLSETGPIRWLISEGDFALAAIWERNAMRKRTRVQRVSPEAWREALLNPRDCRDAASAKRAAIALAHKIIVWSGAPKPTSLTHDAAEAICVGLWAVVALGWLKELPREIVQPQALVRQLPNAERPGERQRRAEPLRRAAGM